jgi:hypothetical protein
MKEHHLRPTRLPSNWCRAALRCGALVILSATPALGYDSTAELPVGGLTFSRGTEISVESQELTITPEQVSVRYVFQNQSDKPATVTITFPFPEIDLSEAENFAIPADDPVNFVAFATRVDGKSVSFKISQRAVLGEKDVSASIKSAGLPLFPIATQQNRIAELPKEARERLVGEGLLLQAGTDVKGEPLYAGTWTVKTTAVRQQTFAAGKPVVVEHRYRTSMGVSFDTVLRKGLRENTMMEAEIKRYRASYCVPDELLRGLDRIAGDAEANTAGMRERRISYLLTTGASGLGPVKDFKLTVDKGKPDRLISFCLDNVKKVSPTAFEVRMKDFLPEKDLKILLIGKAD